MSLEKKIAEMKLQLPSAPKAIGAYRTITRVGNLVYLAGHLPIRPDGSLAAGRAESDDDIQHGYQQAKLCGLAMLATLKEFLGSLDNVKRVVKVLGMVASPDSFTAHPKIINGCSELFAEVFGEENGVGVRSAFGVSSLPMGVMVEIEGIFEVDE